MVPVYTNPYIQTARQSDPRLAYARALMQNGASTAPVQSWGEGLARALQGGLGGYFQGQSEREYKTRDDAYQTTMADALAKFGTDPDAAVAALGANPDTASTAFGYRMKLAETDAAAKAQLVRELAGKGLQLDPNTGGVVAMPGFGQASGQIAAQGLEAQIPAKVAEATALNVPKLGYEQSLNPIMASRAAGTAQAQLPAQKELAQFNTNLDISSAGPKAAAAAAATEPFKSIELVTLISPNGEAVTLDKKDSKVSELIKSGYTQRSGADPNSTKFTEDQRKNAQLYLESSRELPILMDNFKTLTNTRAQIASMGPEAVKNWATSPEYQRALNSLAVIIRNNLYSISGATVTPEEAKGRAATLLPSIGESDAAVADKQVRIQNLLDGQKMRAGGAADEVDKGNEIFFQNQMSPAQKALNAKFGVPGG